MKPENFQFLEKYWIFLNSIFTGMVIGFGLSGYDITSIHPIIITIWIGLFVFDYIFGRRLKSSVSE